MPHESIDSIQWNEQCIGFIIKIGLKFMRLTSIKLSQINSINSSTQKI